MIIIKIYVFIHANCPMSAKHPHTIKYMNHKLVGLCGPQLYEYYYGSKHKGMNCLNIHVSKNKKKKERKKNMD